MRAQDPASQDGGSPEGDLYESEVTPVPGLYLYNNVALDALLINNIGFEADLSDHWSVAVPVFHSGWNYFGQKTTKFRCLGVRPEVRWWPFRKHIFYAGAHVATSFFNVACKPLSDTYRFQSTDGKKPLFGGGLDVGAKIPLTERFSLLVSAGAGVYVLDFDTFYLDDFGFKADSGIRKLYFGPDFLQISVVYRFNRLGKTEERR